jgi:hypothetical protein
LKLQLCCKNTSKYYDILLFKNSMEGRKGKEKGERVMAVKFLEKLVI